MRLLTLLMIVGIVFVSGCIYFFPESGNQTFGNETYQEQTKKYEKVETGIPLCGSNNELFTTSPTSLSNLATIVPLGNLNPSGHVFPTRHLYLSGLTQEEFDVFSPGDIYITSIRSSENKNQNYTDYSIYFSPCREFQAYFFHIRSISQKLKGSFAEPYDNCDEYTTGGTAYKTCDKRVNIQVKAGEVIGTVGGKQGQVLVFDFGASDTRTPELQFANPSRWYDMQLHTVCALDYFVQPLRDELKSKLGDWDGTPRTIEPICGEVEQDEPNTAQGIWFLKGTRDTYPEDPHISLVHDNFDPTLGVFSIGTSIKESRGTYWFRPTASGFVNRDFKDVTAGGSIYCYEPMERFSNTPIPSTILIQLTSETTLRVEKQSASSCSSTLSFGSNYVDFER